MRFRFGWDEEDIDCIRLKLVLLQQIQKLRSSGVAQFMTACDPGVGLWCGEIINALRNCNDDLQLYCALPYEEQATKWAPYLRKRYFELLEKCTYVSAVSLHKTHSSQLNAYKYIINQSDVILAVYDPASVRGDDVDKAMEYARDKTRPVIFIHPDTFKITYP
ncbi:MAG: DUF1273 domain-containing protein [Intestinimonas sp.]|jgi:uncharacterized phage-like protein YoqJ|nr:DUF1273 domain-containing protein [Intestinimonas sp.]